MSYPRTIQLSYLAMLLVVAPAAASPVISTVTLQNGVNSYSGTLDRKISPGGGADANGIDINTDSASYFLDGGATALNDSGARHGLLRFDGVSSAVPVGAKVIRATVDVVTNGVTDAQSGGTYNLYRLNTAFDSLSTWDSPFGGNGLTGDVGEILGSFDRPALNTPISARADRTVQAWIDGEPNLGFGIRSDRSTDGWSLHTTGTPTVANRPKLTIQYTLNPYVEVKSYQQGIEGYTGTVDFRFNSASGATANGANFQELFLDGYDPTLATPSPDQSYVVRFDGINLNYREIYRAELILVTGFTSADADSPGPFTVHQLLRDWSPSTSYASIDSDGDPTVNTLTELLANGDIAPAAATVVGMNDTEVMHIDVTSIVRNWRAGQPNYGFYLGTPSVADGGTSNGWQIFVSGANDPTFRPHLRIIGILVPEPATTLLTTIVIAVGFVSRNRRK